MNLAVRRDEKVCWWAVLAWVGIAAYCILFWTGVGFGVYYLTTDPAPRVSCSKPVLVELDNGAISTVHCNTER